VSRAHSKGAWYGQLGARIQMAVVVKIVEIAESRCLAVEDLAPIVMNALCSDKHPDSRAYYDAWQDAGEINKLGVTEQVLWLVEEFGYARAEEIVRSKGGILLAIARAAAEGDKQ